MTMRIQMRETRAGSPDGRVVYTYEAGEIYDAETIPPVDDDLAAVFVREGWADDVAAVSKPASAAKRATKVSKPDEGKDDANSTEEE